MINAGGQRNYPKGSNHFNPNAIMYAPHQFWQIIMSDVGIIIWLSALGAAIKHWGFSTVLIVYIIPYFWLVLSSYNSIPSMADLFV